MENIREYTDKGKVKYWNELPNKLSEEDAYLIGYLACDGGYVINGKYPFMMVSSTELSIIEWIRKSYVPTMNIYNVGMKSSERVNAINPVYELRFPTRGSYQFKRFGIFCKKSNRRVVGISDQNLTPYMAGVIDADGFISVTHRRDCRTPRLRFFITHQSELYLADLQNRLPIPTTLRQHGKNVWRLQAQNTTENITYLSSVLPFLKNRKKIQVLLTYLNKFDVPQASGELLESLGQSAAKPHDEEGSETTGIMDE